MGALSISRDLGANINQDYSRENFTLMTKFISSQMNDYPDHDDKKNTES